MRVFLCQLPAHLLQLPADPRQIQISVKSVQLEVPGGDTATAQPVKQMLGEEGLGLADNILDRLMAPGHS